MEPSQRIDEIHRSINSNERMPHLALRRNSIEYPLISDINNIYSLLRSDNLHPVPVLTQRAHNLRINIIENGGTSTEPGQSDFLGLVSKFLILVVEQIAQHNVEFPDGWDINKLRSALENDDWIESTSG